MLEEHSKTYFVTGGGTGGHIYPALAVADGLSELDNTKVYYVGNKRNMEYKLASNYNFLHVSVSGMPRKLSPKFIFWGIALCFAILKSIIYILKYAPNCVFATGGYVSAPMIFACIITNTPYVMHDCDAIPGLVTRKLSKKAKHITLAFESAKNFIENKNIIVTGNPIRKEFQQLDKFSARTNLDIKNKTTLCIMGGSQGAKSINNATIELLKELSEKYDLQIIFQTGKKNFENVNKRLLQIYPNYKDDKNLIIEPYFMDMVSVLKSSDIVIARAGSLSISEICASETSPILIPYPYAAADHQRKNAIYMQEKGACIYIEDNELDANILKSAIIDLLQNPAKREYLKQNASHLARYNAVDDIIKNIIEG